VWGQGVTFTATVTGSGSPTGVVTFSDGPTSIGQGTLSTIAGKTTASFSTSSLAVASHAITASYAGDSTFQASSASLGQTVAKAGSTTAVTSSLNPSVWGKSVTLTATVAASAPGAGTPTGTVQFQIDGSDAGSAVGVSTSGGVTTAAFSTTSLAVGSHTITASYSGDDSLTLPILSVGGRGVISVASHLVGPDIQEMVRAYERGDTRKALQLHLRLFALYKVLFITTNPVPLKAALNLSGFRVGKPRLPLVEATAKEKEQIQAVLTDLALVAV